MELRKMWKDIEYGGRRYRIGLIPADVGSYVAFQLLLQLAPTIQEALLGTSMADLQGDISSILSEDMMGKAVKLLSKIQETLPEKQFMALQTKCLSVCSQVVIENGQEVVWPVVMQSGQFSIPDLKYDVVGVIALFANALWFNISPFFAEGALPGLMNSFQEVTPNQVHPMSAYPVGQ